MSPAINVDPIHGCEHCCFIAELLQHPEFPVYDLLNGVAVKEFWDVIRLSLYKLRCDGCK